MRKVMYGAMLAGPLLLAGTGVSSAQRARVSPHESTAATVGRADLEIVYGRPYTRGRVIFGGLVPYGEIWCPGADEATMLSTSRPLRFGTLAVPAGEYSLWILPTEESWTLIFNRQAHTFHTRHRPSEDLGRIALETHILPEPVEQLTFVIEERDAGGGGRIVMRWATTEVAAPFVVQ
jgi:hypothetical protein